MLESQNNTVRLAVRAAQLRSWPGSPVTTNGPGAPLELFDRPAVVNLDDPSLYINRELSWLEFNRRVLEEAQDPEVSLLERLKFPAIFSTNLDEFFMVRVGGLQQKVQSGIARGSGADRMAPLEQLERISQLVRQMVGEQYRCLMENVLPVLEPEGIVLRGLTELNDGDRRYLSEVFRREVFPVLTPLAIDPGHPFPHLLNKSLNLAVVLHRPNHDKRYFAVVQVPAVLPHMCNCHRRGTCSPLENVILHLLELFPGMEPIIQCSRHGTASTKSTTTKWKTCSKRSRKSARGAGRAVRLEIDGGAPSLSSFS